MLLHYIFVIRCYVASVLESYRPSDYESWRSLQLRSTLKRSSMEDSQVNMRCNNSHNQRQARTIALLLLAQHTLDELNNSVEFCV